MGIRDIAIFTTSLFNICSIFYNIMINLNQMYLLILYSSFISFLISILYGRFMGIRGIAIFITSLFNICSIFLFYEICCLRSTCYVDLLTWLNVGYLYQMCLDLVILSINSLIKMFGCLYMIVLVLFFFLHSRLGYLYQMCLDLVILSINSLTKMFGCLYIYLAFFFSIFIKIFVFYFKNFYFYYINTCFTI